MNKENSKYYKELKKKCYDKNEIIRILLFSKETIYSLTDILNSCNHLNNLLEKFIDGSYIKKLEIQKPFYGCLIFGGFNEIVYQNEDNLYIACEFINNDRLYYKIIKKINVGLKYNSLYDIVKIKNKRYIIEFKLIDILILENTKIINKNINEGSNLPNLIDETLYMFMKQYKYIDDIIEEYDIKQNRNIIGSLEITLKPLYDKNNTFESLTNNFNMNTFLNKTPDEIYRDGVVSTNLTIQHISFIFKKYNYDLESRFKYYYTYEKCINLINKKLDILPDEELISLFSKPKKNKKNKKKEDTKKKLETKEEIKEELKEELKEEENIILEEKEEDINILYVNNNRCLMSELLIKELIYENEYFKNLYRQYKNVLIFKNINKCYTDNRYINFKFVYNIYNKTDTSKSYHGYLDKYNNITNITYIESIKL